MPDRGHRQLLRIDLGLTKYKDAWGIQKKLVRLRAEDRIPDCIITTEHEPVITLGRGSSRENLLVSSGTLEEREIDFFEIERGGDITFHGPGQAVLYPIIDLNNRSRDVHQYLRDLEHFVIAALEDIGLEAQTRDGMTGIWVGDFKIGAIGVAVSRWITFHGLALNVTTDLEYYRLINPCGITDYPVGSISGLLEEEIEINEVFELLVEKFAELFHYEIVQIVDLAELLPEHRLDLRTINSDEEPEE